MEDFSKYNIKDYKYWSVSIFPNQGYLGRCIIWCNRADALDLTDATPEEREELFVVLKELGRAVQKSFQPDWLNYSFLGNVTRHLHGHFIPRYATPREFEEITFKDELYGHNYNSDIKFVIPDAVVEKIRLKIREALG